MAAIPNLEPPSLALVDELATPLLLLDRDGRVRYANPACASWLGVSARRLVDQPLAALESGEPRLDALVARALAQGMPARASRVRFAPTSGVEHYADVAASPLARDDGCACALECHPVAEFPGEDPALALPAALSAALKGLAHEVRNPLAGLRGAAQLLAKRLPADADAQRCLAVVVEEADRLAALVERLLNPSPPKPFEPVNVHEVLERVRVLAEADAGWAVVLQRDYDPSLPAIAGDADRLAQALWNLLRNALESGATEVKLRTRAEHNVPIGEAVAKLALRLEVVDDGRGVPDDLGTRIFLPLVSGRASGSGLGLSLAQQVAREHGGALSYRSRPGHTVFTLLLPVVLADAP